MDADRIQIAKFWYNDPEIFHCTQDDFNRRAEMFSKQGITHVDCKTCTHFRWSFYPYWDLLRETLARIVKACHAHAIKVIEHHSVALTFNPATPEEQAWVDDMMARHHSMLDHWPGVRAFCSEDPVIDGTRLSSMRQIDGRTGAWARSNYRGWVMCSVNPDFRRLYLNYLESLYALGIDGLMTDELQWYGRGHACACPHCRKLFAERTGYEMPPPREWERWQGNYRDPSFVAWLDFRHKAIEDSHRVIKEHYEALGLRPFRPSYSSTRLSVDMTCVCLEHFPDLDVVSVECTYPHIIRYAWPFWAIEAAQRFTTGRILGIPSGAISFPDRPDTILFMWALSKSWGALFLTSGTGGEEDNERNHEMFARLRSFEKEHPHLFLPSRQPAPIGFYDSRNTVNLYQQARGRSLVNMRAWLHACYRSNMPFDVFAEAELSEIGPRYRAVVLNETALLSDQEILAFREFAHAGGTLAWIGATGCRNERGHERSERALADALGIRGFVCAADGTPGATYRKDKGQIVTLPCDFGLEADPPRHYSTQRLTDPDAVIPFKNDIAADRRTFKNIANRALAFLGGKVPLKVDHAPEDLLVTAFVLPASGRVVLHIVNAVGTFDLPVGTPIKHADKIPFPGLLGNDNIRLVIDPRAIPVKRSLRNAVYHDPIRSTQSRLEVMSTDAATVIEVPPAYIREYGIIETLQ